MMKKSQAFSLIELMVVLGVASFLLTTAVPNLRSTLQNNLAATQVNYLVVSLTTARSEAIKRSERVAICASVDQICCSGSNNWATGWILFTDEGAVGTLDPGDTIIRVQEPLKGTTVLTSTSLDNFVQFRGNGRINNPGAVAVDFNLTVPGCTGQNVRQFSVSLQGRVTQLPPTACL